MVRIPLLFLQAKLINSLFNHSEEKDAKQPKEVENPQKGVANPQKEAEKPPKRVAKEKVLAVVKNKHLTI